MHSDNKVPLHTTANPVFHKCTKHIEAVSHFVRKKLVSGAIIPYHTPTREELTNTFTKALGQ